MTPLLRRALGYCFAVFVGVRLLLLVLALASVVLFPSLRPVSVPGWPAHPLPDPGWHNLFAVWERFDSLWFLRIAASGYRVGDGSAVFFPLYPLAIRAISWLLGGHPLAAALLVSNATLLGALIVLYLLTTSELNEGVAKASVLFLSLFPTSFFLFAPYSEAPFLLLVVSTFWAARRNRWALAGLLGALAALTRNVGVVLLPALAVEAFQQHREGRGALLPRLAASAAVALGLLAYLVFWGVKDNAFLAPLTRQMNWERTFSWPWATLTNGTKLAVRYIGNTNGGYWLLDWLIVVPILVLAGYAAVRYRPAFGVYTWGSLLIPLSFVFEGRPLMSMPRFVLPLFPAFWALADLSERGRIPRSAVIAVGAAGLGLLLPLYVNWYYIF